MERLGKDQEITQPGQGKRGEEQKKEHYSAEIYRMEELMGKREARKEKKGKIRRCRN